MLVAVTVTFSADAGEGAEYIPVLLTEPALQLHLTPVAQPDVAHATVALNCKVAPATSESVVGLIVTPDTAGTTAAEIDSESVLFAEAPVASVTVTTSLNVPFCVGVPLIAPPVLIPSPGANPVAVNVYGDVPPVALTCVE